MVYFPVPIETTSLRGLALAPLPWPRKGVGLRTVPEVLAAINVDAMTSNFLGLKPQVTSKNDNYWFPEVRRRRVECNIICREREQEGFVVRNRSRSWWWGWYALEQPMRRF